MVFREYDPVRDRAAIQRIWLEVGWIERGQEKTLDRFLSMGRAIVSEIHGEAESLALTTPGTIRYLEEDLPFCGIPAVTTGYIGRRQGLARRLTAHAVASAASEGALVAGLGMFEQGFYDQLGFGTGSYEHTITFDPSQLMVPPASRPPYRLSLEDWEGVHAARLRRRRGHGACNGLSATTTLSDMGWSEKRFGLGYRDGPGGEISHCMWLDAGKPAHGPCRVLWLCHQTREQFIELLGVLRNLGDQLHLVRMAEPPGIQLQDFLRFPLKGRNMTRGSDFEQQCYSGAYIQARICDMAGCLARTHLNSGPVRFNLRLSDPITAWLDEASPWRGVGGDYVLTLGPESRATVGSDPALPLLSASVGAFTRMWLGVRPATGLSISDDLTAPQPLLDQLDRLLCLPPPLPDWDF